MTWDPNQYLKYAGSRLQPAVDLLARTTVQPTTILDLGCGPGNVTRLLAQRWPDAHLVALDNDSAMLERAQVECPTAVLAEADINDYEPDVPQDLIYSNATLHWLDEHAQLLPRLFSWLRPGGELAVQMPAPSINTSAAAAVA